MKPEEFDWDYYQKYEEDIRNGKHFDNNYICWSIIKKARDNSPLSNEIDDLRKLLCKNHEVAPQTFIDIILYIEYLEWKLYLLDVRRFMRIGITYGVFNIETHVKDLKIERFHRRFESLLFSCNCFPYKMIDSKDNSCFALTYNLNFEQFTFLDVSIATGISNYIEHAINIGCCKCIENSYIIPELVRVPIWSNGEEEYARCFMSNIIEHEQIYNNYKCTSKKSNATEQVNNPINSNGIQNILTGGTVQPNDGTYYIDDFR